MRLDECYKILRLGYGAPLEDVKKAFRKMAFDLHPDLNADNPHAARMFQRVNEAYVTLKRELEKQEATGKPAGAKAEPEQDVDPGKTRAGQAAYERQQKTSPPPGAGKKKKPRGKPKPQPHFEERQKEEVLQDILKDPFARQVFEDIYSQIRKGKGKGALKPKAPKPKKKLKLEWGKNNINLDLTDGLWDGTKQWFRSWMDDTQEVLLPAMALRPGGKVRLQVQQGWSGKAVSVEVTLPPDYVMGRAIRLKGLGRKFGPWIGDLYVRLMPK